MADVAEGSAAEGEERGAYLGIADDLDAEDVCEAWTAVLSKSTEDEVLPLLIKDQDARQHRVRVEEEGLGCESRGGMSGRWTCRCLTLRRNLGRLLKRLQ